MKVQLKIEGMSCAGCVAAVEKAINAVPGVDQLNVNFADHSATISGTFNLKQLIESVKNAGYDAALIDDARHVQLKIDGMSCAACVAAVEKAINAVPGVNQATVSFADHSATVSGNMDMTLLAQSIKDAGYGATVLSDQAPEQGHDQEGQRFRQHLYQFVYAGVVGAVLFVGGMFGLFPALSTESRPFWLFMGLLTLSVLLFSARHIYQGAWKILKNGSANMDTLIAMGTGAAWVYSMLISIDPTLVPQLARHVYFEAAAVIIAFVNLGSALEMRARGKTSQAIRRLMGLQAKTARVIRNGREQDVAISEVQLQERVRIRPGEKIPVDGVIEEGHSTVDEAMISGEPVPVSKQPGDEVIAGTLNKSGSFVLSASHVGADTMLARIVEMVKVAQNTKPPIARLADKVAAVFVPTVLIIALLTLFAWWWLGPEPRISFMLVTTMSVLVIACPCALGLATPISIMLGINKAAEFGVLVRDAQALQQAGGIQAVVLDKTGTVTEGKPRLTEIVALEGIDEQQVLRLAASVEKHSEHPLADAIVQAAQARNLELLPVADFESRVGAGVSGTTQGDGLQILCGNDVLMAQAGVCIEVLQKSVSRLSKTAHSIMYLAHGQQLLGLLAVADPVNDKAGVVVEQMHQLGIKVVLASGDQQATCEAVAALLGIDDVHAQLKPQDKLAIIKGLQQKGLCVAMVGDGINDAPALAQADVGFAIGGGTDVAMESAGITLIGDSLQGIVDAVIISRRTLRNIRQNLFGAFVFNTLGIPIAAGVLYPLSGFLLNPMIAGAAMAMSSVSVVSNANRLRHLNPRA